MRPAQSWRSDEDSEGSSIWAAPPQTTRMGPMHSVSLVRWKIVLHDAVVSVVGPEAVAGTLGLSWAAATPNPV